MNFIHCFLDSIFSVNILKINKNSKIKLNQKIICWYTPKELLYIMANLSKIKLFKVKIIFSMNLILSYGNLKFNLSIRNVF